jgi:hypothetical protein
MHTKTTLMAPITMNRTTDDLRASAYMGHTVISASGRKLSWQTLADMPNINHTVEVTGDYMGRIYTIK